MFIRVLAVASGPVSLTASFLSPLKYQAFVRSARDVARECCATHGQPEDERRSKMSDALGNRADCFMARTGGRYRFKKAK